jgi:hypothetical protein
MKILLTLLLALAACRTTPAPDRPNSITHMPSGGCPPGSRELKGIFREKNGSKISACFNPNGDGSIDVINPGESVEFAIGILPPVEIPVPKGKM